jgi:hypothetical protein
MFTIIYTIIYFAFYILNKKADPFLDRLFVFIVALDFYLGFQILVFSNVHEKYGINGPALILTENDPVLGPVNRTTYPLAMRGEYYQALLAISQIQHIVLQYIFAILSVLAIVYALYLSTKKFVESTEEKL